MNVTTATTDARPEATVRYSCRRLAAAELPLLNDLYNVCYQADRPLAEAEWLFAGNPDGPPLIMAAFDPHNELAGVRPAIARKFCWRGEERMAYEFADAMVAPRHRKRGIFTQLVKTTCELAEHEDFTLFTIPNNNSLPIYRRNPMLQVLGECETRVKPLSWPRYLGYRLGLDTQRRRREEDARPPAWTQKHGDVRLTPIIRFDGDFDHVNDDLGQIVAAFPLRRREYLQWRYFGSPVRRYRAALIEQGGEVRGYVVIRMIRGVAHLMDMFLVPDGRLLRGAFRLLNGWCRSLGAIAIRFNASSGNVFHKAAGRGGYWLKKRAETVVIDRRSAELLAAGRGRRLEASDLYFVMGDFDFL